MELNLLRGLDQGGKRVFHAFGPAGETVPFDTTPCVFDTKTGEILDEDADVTIKLQLYDSWGGARFLPPRALMVTNN